MVPNRGQNYGRWNEDFGNNEDVHGDEKNDEKIITRFEYDSGVCGPGCE